MILSRIVLWLDSPVCFDLQYLVERSAIVIGLSQICLHKRRHLLCVFTFSGSISFFSLQKRRFRERYLCVSSRATGVHWDETKSSAKSSATVAAVRPCERALHISHRHQDDTQIHKCTNTQIHKYINAQIHKYKSTAKAVYISH